MHASEQRFVTYIFIFHRLITTGMKWKVVTMFNGSRVPSQILLVYCSYQPWLCAVAPKTPCTHVYLICANRCSSACTEELPHSQLLSTPGVASPLQSCSIAAPTFYHTRTEARPLPRPGILVRLCCTVTQCRGAATLLRRRATVPPLHHRTAPTLSK